jgi:hypothetical protein
MNIGSLYTVKKFSWLLFPTKAVIAEAGNATGATATAFAATANANAASYWSRVYNCEVTYFSPESFIVFLENDGKLKKVLTSDGKIGWSLFSDHYNDCFEEVKAEP